MIRLLLVDDQQLVRAGLRMLCETAPDMEVVGEADNGNAAIRMAGQLLPDVVLMDLRMPGLDGIAATARIVAARPATRVVALTTFDDDEHLYPVLAAGACGFLVKNAAATELLDGVRRAAAGDSPFSGPVLRRMIDRAVRGSVNATIPPDLTPRERDVLAYVGEGLSNAQIAERLHVGVTTVKTHVAHLLTKTGSPNRIRLAIVAVRSGLASG